MGKTLYLECNSGISGDMAVAALLDLGADQEKLLKVIDSIDADGFEIKISRVKKSGLDCMDFDVVLDAEHDGHDHDMEYLYGHEHVEEHHHEVSSDAHNNGSAGKTGIVEHEHGHNHNHHKHRGMKEINEILDRADMTAGARKIVDDIFDVLARAEAKAHGVAIEDVHFHEVGAIDSIVDVVAFAVCLDDLGITEVIVPKLFDGHGTVRCQHGILPVPVPAVSNIVSEHGIALEILDVKGELVTPTGAAFVAATRTAEALPKEFKIEKIGMGAGKRDTGLAGFLRGMIIEDVGYFGHRSLQNKDYNSCHE